MSYYLLAVQSYSLFPTIQSIAIYISSSHMFRFLLASSSLYIYSEIAQIRCFCKCFIRNAFYKYVFGVFNVFLFTKLVCV